MQRDCSNEINRTSEAAKRIIIQLIGSSITGTNYL